MMMLPLSVYQLLQSADRIDIVCDNPVRPVHSYTEAAPPVLRKRRKNSSWKDRRRANNAAPASCRWSPVLLLSPPLRVVPSPSSLVNDQRAGYASFSPATVASEGRRRRARPVRQVRSLSPVPAIPVRKAGFVDFPPPPVFLQDDDDDEEDSFDDIVDVENSEEDDDISNQTQDEERGMSGSSINDSSSSSSSEEQEEEASELEEAIQRAIAITTAPRRRGRRPTRSSAPTTTNTTKVIPSPEALGRWIEPPLPRGPYESPPQPHVTIAQQMQLQRFHHQQEKSQGLPQDDGDSNSDDERLPNLSPIPSSSSLSSLENTPNSSIPPPLHVFSRWDSHPSKIAASSGADAPPSLFSLQAHHRFRKHLRATSSATQASTSAPPHHHVTEEKLQLLPCVQTRHWSLESFPNMPPLPVQPPQATANASATNSTTGSPTIMVDPPKKPVRRGSFERPRTPPSPSSDTAALLDQALRITTTTTAAEDEKNVRHHRNTHSSNNNSAGHHVPTARLSRP